MKAAPGEKMRFGGVGSKLKGDSKDKEDKRHRAAYETLAGSDRRSCSISLLALSSV
ncbi:hypothetical protein ACP70R_001524 [Stipagrostis hirtigluma subsp. patula]